MIQWRNHRSFHLARDANDDDSILHHLSDFHLGSLAHLSKRLPQDGGDGQPSSGSSSSSSDTNTKPSTINTQTLPLVLGILIPAVCAFIMFVVFHLRHKKKQAIEDATDKHHSLDFGLGEVHRPPTANKKRKGKNGLPEMTITDLTAEKALRRGVSADLGSPYLIAAAEFQESRTSFNSLSRETSEPNDPYGPVKQMRDRSRSPHPAASVSKKSVRRLSSGRKPLLARKNSSSTAPPYSSTANTRSNSPSGSPTLEVGPEKPFDKEDVPLPPPPPPPPEDEKELAKRPTSNFSFPRNVDRSSLASKSADPARNSPPPPMPPARTSSKPARMGSIDGKINEPMPADGLALYSTYTDGLGISADPTQSPSQQGLAPIHEPVPQRGASLAPPNASPNLADPRRLSTAIRPLPNVNPDDNAETRANRIRSFYKEYFNGDDNGEEAGDDGGYGYGDYGSYDQEYLDEAPIWDPATGQFVMAGNGGPGWGRRAMTPPPRGPPRFRGQAGGHHYTSSSGHSYNGRARAYSSASGRAPPRGRPVKRLPPPKPLHTLPSVSNLKESENSSLLDFAPPPSMRDIVAGRPSSPRSEQRPYSPSIRAHTPIVGTTTEMSVMPSPFALRKSGTFTGLDFAPPPRFRLNDSASDSGSIRSGRSARTAMSPAAAYNVRAGAYRLSRLPKDTVGTKDDLAATLRPQWGVHR